MSQTLLLQVVGYYDGHVMEVLGLNRSECLCKGLAATQNGRFQESKLSSGLQNGGTVTGRLGC